MAGPEIGQEVDPADLVPIGAEVPESALGGPAPPATAPPSQTGTVGRFLSNFW